MFVTSIERTQKLRNKRYRDAFVASRVRNWIAYQIRTIREQRGWSQVKFGEKIGKPQSVISRLEDPNYGKLTLQTLFDVAATLNVALVIKFVDFSSFLRQTADVSPEAMMVEEYKKTTSASESVFALLANSDGGNEVVEQVVPTSSMVAAQSLVSADGCHVG